MIKSIAHYANKFISDFFEEIHPPIFSHRQSNILLLSLIDSNRRQILFLVTLELEIWEKKPVASVSQKLELIPWKYSTKCSSFHFNFVGWMNKVYWHCETCETKVQMNQTIPSFELITCKLRDSVRRAYQCVSVVSLFVMVMWINPSSFVVIITNHHLTDMIHFNQMLSKSICYSCVCIAFNWIGFIIVSAVLVVWLWCACDM